MSRLPNTEIAAEAAASRSARGVRPTSTAFDLTGKIALVTGASGGLGRHFALTLAAAGAKVALAARRTEQTEAVAGEIEESGGTAIAVSMDVTEEASVARGLSETSERLGAPTVVINNSGVARNEPALELTLADWDQVLDTNTRGAFVVARAAAQAMIAAKAGGSIINIASILGIRVAGRVAAYCASKAALLQLTRTLALEWARFNIRVNAIAPGYIDTDMVAAVPAEVLAKIVARIPVGRLGKAEEIARGVLFLVADDAGFITGSTMSINGGQHMY